MMDENAKRRVLKNFTDKYNKKMNINKPVRVMHYGFFYARCGGGSQLIVVKMEEVTCIDCRKLINADKIIKGVFGGKT